MLRPSTSRGLPALGCADSRTRRHRRHPLDRLEHRRRPDAQLTPMTSRRAASSSRREPLGRRAVQRVAVLLGRHLRDDRQVGHAAHGVDRRADLVQVAERLEDEQVDAAFDERLRLLAEVLARLVDAGLAPRLDADAERPDRAGDVRLVARRRGARCCAPCALMARSLSARPNDRA